MRSPSIRLRINLLWQHVVYSKSEEDFGKAWVRLQKDFQDQQPLLRYLREEWLPLKKQWACCYTRFYHNFGFITTSLAESHNGSIKTYNLSLRSDLPEVAEATASQTNDKFQLWKDKCIAAHTTIRHKYSSREWLGELPLTVTRWCLDQLDSLHLQALETLPSSQHPTGRPLLPCTGSTRKQYGLPCAHELLVWYHEGQPLQRSDIDPFWWIKHRRDDADPLLRVLRPHIAIPKGRPRGEGPFGNEEAIPQVPHPQGSTRGGIRASARRNYSQFELGDSLEAADCRDTIIVAQSQPKRPRKETPVSNPWLAKINEANRRQKEKDVQEELDLQLLQSTGLEEEEEDPELRALCEHYVVQAQERQARNAQ